MNLSHIDKTGTMRMVNVSAKKPQKRTAVAVGTIAMAEETLGLLKGGLLKKGDALACSMVAGIMAAKKTSELIPLCHNLFLDNVDIDFLIRKKDVEIRATAVCTGRTGVEMEALTAVSVAALTIYDMCKAVDKNMIIGKIRLIDKQKEKAS
jgi:cyclic pyranopterin phosphate synthase